jgi:hypothetical protein
MSLPTLWTTLREKRSCRQISVPSVRAEHLAGCGHGPKFTGDWVT